MADFLDADGITTGVFDVVELDDEVAPEDRGRVIAGRYEIVERIGAGGMGQVLHVRHRRLGKAFALKLMQAELTLDEEARNLFKKEARVASALCHPNIVSVIDFGDDPDWGLFITMELLEGESLLERIARGGRIAPELACHVAAQLASALEHSHAMQVVHSDVKAENVICVAGGGSEWDVKLLDFGTAHIASRRGAEPQPIAGTPEYMAPERITGGPPQPSNDIYALGVLLYELLTGTPPFHGDDPMAVLQAHLHDIPEPAGARRGEVLDDELEHIVSRALHKDPAQRFASATELGAALEAYMDTAGTRQRTLEQKQGIADYSHEEAASDAFEALGVAAAGLDVDGTIRVANAAFARLVKVESAGALIGCSVVATAMGDVHPNIRDDLRVVAMTGKLVRRGARVMLPNGKELALRLVMTPARGRCGACMLVVHGT